MNSDIDAIIGAQGRLANLVMTPRWRQLIEDCKAHAAADGRPQPEPVMSNTPARDVAAARRWWVDLDTTVATIRNLILAEED